MDIRFDDHTLTLRGDFDARSTEAVRDAIQAHLQQAEAHLVIDLTEVDTADLTALRVLAFATLQAGRHGQHLTLRGCTPAVRRLLHLSRLARVVEVERIAASA